MRRLGILLAVALLGSAGGASASPRPTEVRIAFVRDGSVVVVPRTLPPRVAPAAYAVRQMLYGPTPLERADGVRTAFATGTILRSLRLVEDTYVGSFSARLLAPATSRTMATRVAQLAATLSRLRSGALLAIAVNGRLVDAVPLAPRPPTWRPKDVPAAGPVHTGAYQYSVRGIQLRLWSLGYLDRDEVTGVADYITSQALLAFQGWEGLGRTGTVDESVQIELTRARRPRPAGPGSGRRVEIHRERGVVLMIDGNTVVRAVHTSTGAYSRTHPGLFRVYRKERLSWSHLFSVWMPYASYFDGGRAMHEYPDVPAFPASHGCVRLPAGDAIRVWEFVSLGTPVRVF